MNSAELKTLQESIKEKYRIQPESAMVTLKAKATAGEGITCKIETRQAILEAGLHPATGGDGLTLCSGDMLLESLAACAGVTLKAVATAIDFHFSDARVFVEGDLDFRGTLSVDKEAPVGFKNIRLLFDIISDETAERKQKLVKLTERFCVVYQTLANKNNIEVNIR